MNNPFPEALNFAEPAVFWMLTIALPLIFLKIATDRKAKQASRRFVSGHLRRRLVPRGGLFDWGIFGLRLIGLSLFIVALARPQLGETTEEIETEGRSILIAIDTSKSMLARDLNPDRLTHAKLAAQDLVEGLGGDRVGLIAFAGKPFLQAPLTIDHGAVVSFISRLDIDSAPRGGSNLADAITLALTTFDKDIGGSHALIVFSDGDELEGSASRIARKAKEKNVLIITIGTGTQKGEIIPDPEKPGDFIKDDTGKIVRTQLHPSTLRDVARITGGFYFDLGTTSLTADAIGGALAKIDTRTFEANEEVKRIERYKIPLAAGMIFFLLSFIARLFTPVRQAPVVAKFSPAALMIPILVAGLSIVLPSEVAAADGDLPADPKALFEAGSYKESAEAYRKLVEAVTGETEPGGSATPQNPDGGESEEGVDERGAVAEYDGKSNEGPFSKIISNWVAKRPAADPEEAARWRYGAGAAAYRSNDFETAQHAFSGALQTSEPGLRSKAHHGLAGTLFRRGETVKKENTKKAYSLWREALEHYEETIKLDPENKVAPKNAAYIRHLLEQEKQPEEKPEPKEEKPEEEKPDEKKEEEKGEQEKPEEPPKEEKPEPEKGEGEQEKPEEEKGAGEPEEGKPEGNEGEKEEDPSEAEGEGGEGEPEETEAQRAAKAALEQAMRYSDEDLSVRFGAKAFRTRGFKDW